MGESQAEWQVQESQWQMEHEEEVRALRQRNSQLLQMLEDTRSHYQEYIAEQEREVELYVHDIISSCIDSQNLLCRMQSLYKS